MTKKHGWSPSQAENSLSTGSSTQLEIILTITLQQNHIWPEEMLMNHYIKTKFLPANYMFVPPAFLYLQHKRYKMT